MNKRSLLVTFGIFIFLTSQPFGVQAADRAYFTADKTILLIGEPTQLLLHIRAPQNAQLNLPDFTKSLSPFMVKGIGALILAQQFQDSSVEYQIPLEIILWRTGKFQTPQLTISYQLAGSPTVNLNVEALQFEVPSTLNDADLSLRPFKPLVNLPYVPVWIMLPIAILAIGMAVLLRRQRHGQIRKRTARDADTAISGHPEAVYVLRALRQIDQSNESPLKIYIQVSDCLRLYLFKRYSIQALDLTTSELVEKLNAKIMLSEDHQQKLVEMLKRADLVKFAGVVPKLGAAQQYISVAVQWIQSVEQSNGEPAL